MLNTRTEIKGRDLGDRDEKRNAVGPGGMLYSCHLLSVGYDCIEIKISVVSNVIFFYSAMISWLVNVLYLPIYTNKNSMHENIRTKTTAKNCVAHCSTK